MSKSVIFKAVAGTILCAAPLYAGFAQAWTPGSEIVGQSVQVETNGIVNTIHFEQGGVARIATPAGNAVPASWSVENNMLCLSAGGDQECWPYRQPFQAGQQMTMTSTCQIASRWLPLSTNQPPEPPSQSALGERG